jgi:hypothetical protein
MNRWVWGHTPPEKKILTILVLEIKEGKNAEKIINNNNLSITY